MGGGVLRLFALLIRCLSADKTNDLGGFSRCGECRGMVAGGRTRRWWGYRSETSRHSHGCERWIIVACCNSLKGCALRHVIHHGCRHRRCYWIRRDPAMAEVEPSRATATASRTMRRRPPGVDHCHRAPTPPVWGGGGGGGGRSAVDGRR